MAKQRRPVRTAAKAKAATKSTRTAAPKRASRGTVPAAKRGGSRTGQRPRRTAAPVKAVKTVPRAVEAPAPAEAPAAARKPGFYEAVAIYERGVQALQRHDYTGAAEQFRAILERYPDERELLERARLYLRVCERETARRPAAPRTAAERVYAATVALNSGDHAAAADHLQRALLEEPDDDHAHYTMAVALGGRGRIAEALGYLKTAIGLNAENRALARQDPDLEPVRGHRDFPAVLDSPLLRRRAKPRR
ncbi:MAG: tetratricopeptide repeat protein [Acidobacteria bacterium]|nr:tetratricopeptide repeat protein [Acidobacteriota bacterium]